MSNLDSSGHDVRLKRRIKRKFMTKRAPHSSLHISHRVARIWLHGCNLVALICAPLLVSLVKYCSDISLSCNLKLRLPATCLFQLTQKKEANAGYCTFRKSCWNELSSHKFFILYNVMIAKHVAGLLTRSTGKAIKSSTNTLVLLLHSS